MVSQLNLEGRVDVNQVKGGAKEFPGKNPAGAKIWKRDQHGAWTWLERKLVKSGKQGQVEGSNLTGVVGANAGPGGWAGMPLRHGGRGRELFCLSCRVSAGSGE